MFTGIVQHVGTVKALRSTAGGARLGIDLGPQAQGLKLGDSVAVNGACLTASAIQGSLAEFDVIAETLRRTGLGRLQAGSKVNLERALRVGDGLDGHIVQGHVDGLAEVTRIDRSAGQWLVHFACEGRLTEEMVSKGSIAIDGVSLTLVDVGQGSFSVALIPTTLTHTTLADMQAGRAVNIETDILGKYVRKLLGRSPEPTSGGLTAEKLRQAGF